MIRIDAAAYWPPTNRSFFFSGRDCIQYRMARDAQHPAEGAEEMMRISSRWHGLKYEHGIDAATTIWGPGPPENAEIYFFKDDTFVTYSVRDDAALHDPRPVTDKFRDLPPNFRGNFDTVLYLPTEGKTYFFKGGEYVRYNMVSGTTETAQPNPISRYWRGLTFVNIDASLLGNREIAYFFKGEEYIRYAVIPDRAAGPAMLLKPPPPAAPKWPGLVEMLQLCDQDAPPVLADDLVVASAKSQRDAAMFAAGSRLMELEARLASGGAADPQSNVVQAVAKWLLVPPGDPRFEPTVRNAVTFVNRAIAVHARITIDRSSTDYAHVSHDFDPAKGVVVGGPFFAANSACQREVIAHEFFHLAGLREHFYGTTNPDEAIQSAHSFAELVFEIATGSTLGCASAPEACVAPEP